MLECEAIAGPREIRTDHAAFWRRRTLKQHVLDAHVVMKPFEMAQSRNGASDVQMQSRCAMTGQIDLERLAQCANLQKRRSRRRSA